MMDYKINVRISEHYYNKFKKIAEDLGMSISELIRVIIYTEVENFERTKSIKSDEA